MNTTPKPGQIAILAGGAVLLIFSFVDWGGDSNAWDAFGVFTWPALFGLIAAGTLAATLFGNVELPDNILSFNWQQLRLVLGFTSTLILLGLLFLDGDKGAGYWFSFLGAIALLAGSVMELLDTTGDSSSPRPGNQPPSPF